MSQVAVQLPVGRTGENTHAQIIDRGLVNFVDDDPGLCPNVIRSGQKFDYHQRWPQDHDSYSKQCHAKRPIGFDKREFRVYHENQTETRKGNPLEGVVDLDHVQSCSVSISHFRLGGHFSRVRESRRSMTRVPSVQGTRRDKIQPRSFSPNRTGIAR
jgi:hypothetical protein